MSLTTTDSSRDPMPMAADATPATCRNSKTESLVSIEDDVKPKMNKDEEADNVDTVRRTWIFVLISLLAFFANYDMGAVAILINWIEKPYSFSITELGVLGALPYIGLIITTPFVGPAFAHLNAKWFMATGLFFNVLSLVVFFLSINKYMFYVSRFMIGTTQSMFVIYSPVWVSCFAPKTQKNKWMAILQGALSMGFILGYWATAMFNYIGKDGWRYSIGSQAVILLLLVCIFVNQRDDFISIPVKANTNDVNAAKITFMKKESIEEGCTRNATDNETGITRTTRSTVASRIGSTCVMTNQSFFDRITSDISAIPSMRSSRNYYDWNGEAPSIPEEYLRRESRHKPKLRSALWTIFSNPYFCFSTLVVTVLFYTLTAIQFWTTKVAIKIYNIPEQMVYIVFILAAVSAPLSGIAIGSITIDHLSNHYPTEPIFIDQIIMSFSTVAMAFAFSAVSFRNFYNLLASIWMILFAGGCMLPSLTLITIADIPDELKPMASGLTMCIYHIMGYIGGTFIPGSIVDLTGNDRSILWATYMPAALGVVGTFGNVISRHLEQRAKKNNVSIVT